VAGRSDQRDSDYGEDYQDAVLFDHV